VFDFAGTDSEGEGTKGSVGGGVRVAAHRNAPGKGKSLLGTDNVDDALTFVGK